jgi:hypothetical protein
LRVILDESVPQRLRLMLPDFEIETAVWKGWANTPDHKLLIKAQDAGYDCFLTCDKSLPLENKISKFSLAVVVLVSPQLKHLVPLLPQIRHAIKNTPIGQAVWLEARQ